MTQTLLQKVLARFDIESTASKLEEERLKLLLMLGEDPEAHKTAYDEADKGKVKERIHKQYNLEQGRKSALNNEILKTLEPYVYDRENLKAKYINKSPTFWDEIFRRLSSGRYGVGHSRAVEHIGDCISHILENIDLFVRGEDVLKRTTHEPLAILRIEKDDPNRQKFWEYDKDDAGKTIFRTNKELPLRLEIKSVRLDDPYKMKVELSGKDIETKEYDMNTENSKLMLEEGHKFKAHPSTILSIVKDDRELAIYIEKASRGFEEHVQLTTSQIHDVLERGVNHYVKVEMKRLMGDEEKSLVEVKKLWKGIDNIQTEINKVVEKIKTLKKGDPGYSEAANKLTDLANEREDLHDKLHEREKVLVPEAELMEEEEIEPPHGKMLDKWIELQERDPRFHDFLRGRHIEDYDLRKLFFKKSTVDYDSIEKISSGSDDSFSETEEQPVPMGDPRVRWRPKDIGWGGYLPSGRGEPSGATPSDFRELQKRIVKSLEGLGGSLEYGRGDTKVTLPIEDLTKILLGVLKSGVIKWLDRFIKALKNYGEVHNINGLINSSEATLNRLIKEYMSHIRAAVKSDPELHEMKDMLLRPALKILKESTDQRVMDMRHELGVFWAKKEKKPAELADIYKRIKEMDNISPVEYAEHLWSPTFEGIRKMAFNGDLEDVGRIVHVLSDVLPKERLGQLEHTYKSAVQSVEFAKLLGELWQDPIANMEKLRGLYSEIGRSGISDFTGGVWDGTVDGFQTYMDRDPRKAIVALKSISDIPHIGMGMIEHMRKMILHRAAGEKDDLLKLDLLVEYLEKFRDEKKTQSEVSLLRKLRREIAKIIQFADDPEKKKLRERIPWLFPSLKEKEEKKEHKKKEKVFEVSDIEEIMERRSPGFSWAF